MAISNALTSTNSYAEGISVLTIVDDGGALEVSKHIYTGTQSQNWTRSLRTMIRRSALPRPLAERVWSSSMDLFELRSHGGQHRNTKQLTTLESEG